MRAFVTGGTGFLGRRLIRDLLDHGHTVTALVRTYERARQLPAGVRALPGDLTQPAGWQAGLRGAELVFHLAAATQLSRRPTEPARLRRINVDGARQTLTLAAEAGARRIVQVAPLAATQPAGPTAVETEFLRTQRAALQEATAPLQARGAPISVVALDELYGPGWPRGRAGLSGWLERQARRRLAALGAPRVARGWLYVDDAAAGLRLAAERGHPGELYQLAGPAVPLRDALELAARLGAGPAPWLWLSPENIRRLARLLARFRPDAAEQLRALAYPAPRVDPARHGPELGWSARPLAEGLPPTLTWIKETLT